MFNSTDMTMVQRKISGIASYEGLLQLHSVKQADFGQYECEVTNNIGGDADLVQLSPKSKELFH